MSKIVIIPDVHGRRFWRSAVSLAGDDPIVFLGDYLDPYPQEYIYPDDAFEEFVEILLFKEQHPERVTLLLGNHDLHYLDSRFRGSRFDDRNAFRNKTLFLTNIKLFDMGIAFEGDSRQYLLTHAGVLRYWWAEYYGLEKEPTAFDIAAKLNNGLHDALGQKMLFSSLDEVSRYRGGGALYGSPVWADINEHSDKSFEFDGIYQIFGHTKRFTGPLITPFWACLDCSKAFSLDLSSGLISHL